MANNNAFNSIAVDKPRKSAFDLSHSRVFTLNMGDIVPFFVQEAIPGDVFRMNTELLLRFMPMLAPIMHNVNVYTHFFAVPYRLIWDEWEDFVTGGRLGTSKPVHPYFTLNGFSASGSGFVPGSLADYLGFPVKNVSSSANPDFTFSQLPFRAYQLIFNEYYRDQNLSPEIDISKASGLSYFSGSPNPDPSALWPSSANVLRKRAWEKDYFTSALPFTQRGAPMSLPISGNAPLVAGLNKYPTTVGAVTPSGNNHAIFTQAAQDSPLFADMSAVSSATINDLRQAFQIQKWLERSARSGSRYVEQILSFFGVRSSDARLDRPEFLGGGKVPVSISEVLQTSESGDTPLGEFAGHGITAGSSHRFRKFFEEHSFVIGLISVMPRTMYCQGLSRMWTRFDKFDYYWPQFAHLGEQAILNKELYYDSSNLSANDQVFGYTSRYNEYRYVPDSIHGDILSNLDFWTMARIFSARPVLNNSFVQSNPTDRIFPVQDGSHKLVCRVFNNFRAIRPIPRFGDPGGV